METYKCEFPGCTYQSENKDCIDEHHIIPQANKGSNSEFNLIRVCKMCHCKIHIPGSRKGTKHDVLRDDSLIFNKISISTGGLVLEYTDPHTNEDKFHNLDNWRHPLLQNFFEKLKEIQNGSTNN